MTAFDIELARTTPARVRSRSAVAVLGLLVAGCASAPPAAPPPAASPVAAPAAEVSVSPSVRAIVEAPDRADDDRKLDAQRHPAETLAFFGIAPGMKVAEIMAGGGYTAEILARAVGPTGAVYGQNTKFVLERFAEKPWSARLAKPVMKNVVRVDRELEDPLPPEVKGLDAVFMVLFYHDAVGMKVDRDRMNRAIFAALKPGGTYAIIDHSGRPGAGVSEAQTFHRIEEKVVREEIERAGFKLVGEASFLRNPADTRDWNDSPRAAAERRGTSDRFVLKFVKPGFLAAGRAVDLDRRGFSPPAEPSTSTAEPPGDVRLPARPWPASNPRRAGSEWNLRARPKARPA